MLSLTEPCRRCVAGVEMWPACTACGSFDPCECQAEREYRRRPCQSCHGTLRVPSRLGRLAGRDNSFAYPVRRARAHGLTAAQGRAQALNGPLAVWYCQGEDDPGEILVALARGAIILEVEGEFLSLSLDGWTGCFD